MSREAPGAGIGARFIPTREFKDILDFGFFAVINLITDGEITICFGGVFP